jgi:hypothetical protein
MLGRDPRRAAACSGARAHFFQPTQHFLHDLTLLAYSVDPITADGLWLKPTA